MNRAFAALIALAVVGGSSCSDHDHLLGLPLFRMYEQKKNKPYTHSDVFANGRAMRPPVEGTISREKQLELDTGSPPLTMAFLEKGKHKYEIVCATCHGLTGESDWQPTGLKETGSIVATNFVLNPAPSWHQDRLRQKDDRYYYNAISKGFGYMPAFSEIPQEERWAIVAYVRALQVSQRYGYDKLTEAEKHNVELSTQVEAPGHKEHL
jgi:hypothetical protein